MATLYKGYYTFVDNLNFMAQVLSESFDFKCDNVVYPSMNWDDDNVILEYGATNVYDESNGGWLDNKYKKILVETDQSVSATMETLITINSSFGFTLSYNVDGGTPITSHQSVSYLQASDLPTAVKEHATFVGWYYEDTFTTQVQVGDLIDGDTTIYAKFSDLYSVHFDTDGGTAVIDLVDVTTITSLPTTTKQSFVFGGWFYDLNYTNEANVGDPVTHNTILYAKWTFSGTFYATFYNCSAEKERVVKYNFLSNATTYDIYALHPSSLKAPIIDIQKSNNFNFNYCYIPMWDKYYFVTNVTNMLNNIWRISLKCDVLMTYRKQIKKLNCLISRQENDYNAYLVDEKIPTQNNNNIEVIDITTDNRIKSTSISSHPFVVEIGGRIN